MPVVPELQGFYQTISREMMVDARIAQASRSILIGFKVETFPTLLFAERPSLSKKLFVGVSHATSIIAHDDRHLYAFDEVGIFVINQYELALRVLNDILDVRFCKTGAVRNMLVGRICMPQKPTHLIAVMTALAARQP